MEKDIGYKLIKSINLCFIYIQFFHFFFYYLQDIRLYLRVVAVNLLLLFKKVQTENSCCAAVCRLPDGSKGVRQDIVQRLAVCQALLELRRDSLELRVAHRLVLGR